MMSPPELKPPESPPTPDAIPPVVDADGGDMPTEPDDQTAKRWQWREWIAGRETVSSMISTVVHLLILVILAMIIIKAPKQYRPKMISGTSETPPPIEMPNVVVKSNPLETMMIETPGSPDSEKISESINSSIPLYSGPDTKPAPHFEEPTPSDLITPIAQIMGGGIENRSVAKRKEMVEQGQGQPGFPTGPGEEAVERGLRWIAAHQFSDGAWRFNHAREDGPCNGLCDAPGDAASNTAATGLALLAFMGAGYTHVEGPYTKNVSDGLYYMLRHAEKTEYGYDLQQGTMYGQGIATLALCEAYAMTKDPGLKDIAQGAVDFIAHAQNPDDGGWRYDPQQPGDTTVTGWQFMALKSAQMAGLHVDHKVLYNADRFLNSVQLEDGARYGYQSTSPRRSTTAIGLLCRMYMGWGPNMIPINQGVAYLDQWGPSQTSIYYNYYATLVLHHYGGSPWRNWDEKMREYLISRQSNRGHMAGSWYFPDKNGDRGGRLYNTAMAVMILEVYYRYMPLYEEQYGSSQ